MNRSIPVPHDDTVIFDTPWRDIFRLRDRMARRYYRAFSCKVPLVELQSAGNEGIAQSIHDYEGIEGYTFLQVLTRRLTDAMGQTFRRELKGQLAYRRLPGKRTQEISLRHVPHVAIQPHHAAVLSAYEVRTDTKTILAYAKKQLAPRDWAIFFATYQGARTGDLARQFYVDKSIISRSLRRSRAKLQPFCTQGTDEQGWQ